jgi:hypothetical protein
MQQKNWLKLLVVCSLCLFFIACSKGPDVFVCVNDIATKTMYCANSKDDSKTLDIPYDQTDNYVCLSPEHFKAVIDWSELNCKK